MLPRVLLAILVSIPAFPPSVTADTVGGTYVMEFDLSRHLCDEVAQLWIPYPASNGNQRITNISVEGDYTESRVYTDTTHETSMLYARWERGAKSRKLKLVFDAQRKETRCGSLPEEEVAWDRSSFARYLDGTRLLAIDGETKRLSDEITRGKKTVLARARAIYDWCCENTYRDPKTRGCGDGDVCKLLRDPGGKCADLSSIFVALCRASNVPAREVLGIRQAKSDGQDVTRWQHCWAEFYLPGFGWVPVDPADVRKMMLKRNLSLDDKETDQLRRDYWAGVDPYRIKLSTGRDIVLNPKQHGEALNYFMYPFAQIGSRTLDYLDPESFEYRIVYHRN